MKKPSKDPAETVRGKVAMVTGSTDGIGKATALGLAKLGAFVIVVGRDRSKGEAVVAEIRRESRSSGADLLIADLASLAEVRGLADDVLARYERLDVLINNAGILLQSRQESPDGFERMFAVNYLAPFLLTNLLLPLLEHSAPARVVNVSSLVQRFAKIDLDGLQATRRYNSARVYAQSKLADIIFTYELARRLEATGVTANVFEPGVVWTNMPRQQSGGAGLLGKVMRPIMGSPEQGARTSVYLASSVEVEQVSGKFFNRKGQETRSRKISYHRDVAAKLWQLSEQMTGLRHEAETAAVYD